MELLAKFNPFLKELLNISQTNSNRLRSSLCQEKFDMLRILYIENYITANISRKLLAHLQNKRLEKYLY